MPILPSAEERAKRIIEMTRDGYDKLDILDRLKLWVEGVPEEFVESRTEWQEVRDLLGYAVDHIERLRAELEEVRKAPLSPKTPNNQINERLREEMAAETINPDYVAGKVTIEPTDSFDDIKKKLHPGRQIDRGPRRR